MWSTYVLYEVNYCLFTIVSQSVLMIACRRCHGLSYLSQWDILHLHYLIHCLLRKLSLGMQNSFCNNVVYSVTIYTYICMCFGVVYFKMKNTVKHVQQLEECKTFDLVCLYVIAYLISLIRAISVVHTAVKLCSYLDIFFFSWFLYPYIIRCMDSVLFYIFCYFILRYSDI